jgi:nucleoid-associated protein YgaU
MNAKKTALFFTAGAIAVGGTLAAATDAHADPVNWSAIAQCESGNNWSIDTGNGYYGGLQFSEQTWLAEGGGKYAQYPNEASESEQIAIASTMGLGNWPVCGAHSGSTESYSARVDQPTYSAPEARTEAHSTLPEVSGSQGSYTVQSGDTLSAIGEKYGVSWESIWADNTSIVSDPNLIYPGQKLHIPA